MGTTPRGRRYIASRGGWSGHQGISVRNYSPTPATRASKRPFFWRYGGTMYWGRGSLVSIWESGGVASWYPRRMLFFTISVCVQRQRFLARQILYWLILGRQIGSFLGFWSFSSNGPLWTRNLRYIPTRIVEGRRGRRSSPLYILPFRPRSPRAPGWGEEDSGSSLRIGADKLGPRGTQQLRSH